MTALLIIAIILCGMWFTISLAVTMGGASDVDNAFSGVTAFVLAVAITIMSIALGSL